MVVAIDLRRHLSGITVNSHLAHTKMAAYVICHRLISATYQEWLSTTVWHILKWQPMLLVIDLRRHLLEVTVNYRLAHTKITAYVLFVIDLLAPSIRNNCQLPLGPLLKWQAILFAIDVWRHLSGTTVNYRFAHTVIAKNFHFSKIMHYGYWCCHRMQVLYRLHNDWQWSIHIVPIHA